MTYTEIQIVETKFNEIVQKNVTDRYYYEMADRKLNPNDDFHFYIKAPIVMWNHDWNLMLAFANLIKCCIRFNTSDGEFEIW